MRISKVSIRHGFGNWRDLFFLTKTNTKLNETWFVTESTVGMDCLTRKCGFPNCKRLWVPVTLPFNILRPILGPFSLQLVSWSAGEWKIKNDLRKFIDIDIGNWLLEKFTSTLMFTRLPRWPIADALGWSLRSGDFVSQKCIVRA